MDIIPGRIQPAKNINFNIYKLLNLIIFIRNPPAAIKSSDDFGPDSALITHV